ncbi:hypothetical protein KU306_12695 [Haloferax larsenii]|uniref:Capsule polysaccharide biosynthesis protein n=1 Tax=Haloferax larsenii TaxID=302484 RepID=A0ABY5RBR6_HALLR|nr:hypothetical protein [Haloferax larsenii]UVE49762.1 hypothetical protein KU306_12695 [Haloferax larsenii]
MTSLKNTTLRLLSKVGAGTTALRLYDSFTDYTGTVDESISSFDEDTGENGYVVFPLIPGYRTFCLRYSILADAFRRRGYSPILLVDDVTDVPVERAVDDDRTISVQTSYFEKRIPEKFGLEVTGISEYLSSTEVDINESSEIIERYSIDTFAKGSTRRRLKRYSLDLDETEVVREYERFLSLGILLARSVEQLLSVHNTELVVVHEPYYIQGGVPMSVARAKGVRSYSQGFGFRNGTLIFGGQSERSSLPHFTSESVVRSQIDTALSSEEASRVDEIMYGRESGQEMSIDYSSHTNQTAASDGVVSVGMFTNLLWDASLEPEYALYSDVFEWVSDTITAFEDIPDAELIIKTHPAESKRGTRESVTSRIREDFSPLPDNVKLLHPDTDVDTYALIDSLDASVVYNSTVGLESAYRGLPVIVAGETHYRGFGFTIDPETKQEYLALLNDVSQIEPPEETETLAQRYAHLLMAKRHTPFPYFVLDVAQEQEFKKITAADTKPGSEPIETLVTSMLNGDEVVHPST